MLDKARRLASEEFTRLSGREIKAKDCYVVWFSKVLQNWKVLVGTNEISSDEPCGDYAEIMLKSLIMAIKTKLMLMSIQKFQTKFLNKICPKHDIKRLFYFVQQRGRCHVKKS